MKALIETLRGLWRARAPRERIFLAGCAIFLALALLAQALWIAHGERMRLRQQVPQLRLQLADAQRQSGEIRQLQAQPAVPAAQEGAALLAAAATAARGAGVAQAAAQLQLEGPRQIRLRAALPFDAWLAWVAVLQRDARLRLVQCRIDAGDGAGQVKIDALFALPEPA